MRVLLGVIFLTSAVYSITIPEDKVVTKKKQSTPGIKTIEWQDETQNKLQLQIPQTGLFDGENSVEVNGELKLGTNHDLFHIIDAEQTHQREIEDFDQEYASSNVEQQSVYLKKPHQKHEAYLKCPPKETGQLPYVSSCSQFLNCYKGRGVVQNCAPGTLFNAYTLECDYASKVECITDSSNDYTQQSLTALKLKTGCPAGFSGIVPHHYDCSKFISCDNGKEVVMNCGPGTLFSLKINNCDFPYNAECASWSSQFEPSQEIDEEKSHSDYQQPSPPTYTYDHYKPKCPQDAVGLYPHPTDCSKFLNCANGQTFVQDCGPGTVFNPISKVCDFPYNVECETHEEYRPDFDVRKLPGNVEASASTNHESLYCPPNAFGLYPYPNACAKFISCDHGKTIFNECSKGLVFSITNRKCDYPFNVDCTRKNMKNIWSVDHRHEWNQGSLNQQNVGSGGYGEQTLDNSPSTNDYNQWNQQTTGQGSYNQQTAGQNGNKWNQSGYNQWNKPIPSQSGFNQQSLSQTGSDQQNNNKWNQQTVNQNGYNTNQNIDQQNTGAGYNQWNKPSPGQSGYNQQGSSQTGNQQSNNKWNQQTVDQNGYELNQNIDQQNTGTNYHQWNKPNSNQNGYNQQGSGQISGQQSSNKWNQQNAIENGYNFNKNNQQQNTGAGSNQWNKPSAGQSGYNQQGSSQTGNQQSTNKWNQNSYGPNQNIDQQNSGTNYNQWNKPSSSQSGYNQQGSGQIAEHQHGYDVNQNIDQQNTGTGSNQWNKPSPGQSGYNQQGSGQIVNTNKWNQQTVEPNQPGAGEGFNQWNKPTTNQAGYNQQGLSQTSNNKWNQNGYGPNQNAAQTENQESAGQSGYNSQSSGQTKTAQKNKNWNQQTTNNNGYNNFAETGYNQKIQQGQNGQSWAQQSKKDQGDNEILAPGRNNPPKSFKFKEACSTLDFFCTPTQCVPTSMRCDGVVDCPNGDDERNCEQMLNQFALIPNHILAVREKEKFFNVSILDCARSCLSSRGFQCRSFSFRRDDGCCFLTDGNVGSTGALILSYAYDYFEMNALSMNCSNLYVCPNQKCISHKQICDGVNDCGDRIDEKGCSAKAFGYEVKLAGGQAKDEGRIEIKAFGKAGYVCDDKFGLRNADVVCRELGFPLGALEVKGNSYYAQDLGDDVFYMMDDVICLGNETSLRDCDFNGWGISNCETQEVVGVVCKTPQETCPKDHWKCDSVQECLPLAFLCDGVNDCTDESDEASQNCDSPTELRLVGGKTKYEGRVEIRHFGVWGTICDDDFNDDAAKVVCKYLGYPGKATAKKDGTFGPGTGPIWLDQVFCQGNESALQYCVHWNWGEHNCAHDEDVGVVCSNISSEFPEVVESERNAHIENVPESVFMEQCGLRKDAMFLADSEVHFRVIGGAVANRGDYPWQASLRVKQQSKTTHWCGAIVISKKFILTAAHCLQGFSKGAYVVVAGDYNTDEDEGTEQEAFIEEFYIHEEFRKGQKMNNDVAVIKLKGDGFKLTRDVQPICIPTEDIEYETGLNCTISGFGTIQSGKSLYSHDMRSAWIPLIDQEVCKMPHVYGNTITDGMVCAGTLDEGADACEGDSGGPLACLHDGFYTLYGIVSWGHHCGHANKPGVYVRVAKYRKWIDETILKHV